MEPLFDKPMSELREAFVRARFAELDFFARPDIEEWLEGQRENLGKGIDLDPWAQDGFNEIVNRDWDCSEPTTWERVAELMLDHVTLSQDKPDWSEQDPATSRLVEVIETLRAGGAQVFYWVNSSTTTDLLGIAIVEGKAYVILKEGSVLNLEATNKGMAIEFMIEEVRNGGSKAILALEYLILEYHFAIATVRESAERDFDEACAVSANGTKIVKARWVFLYTQTGKWILYPAESFRETKILLLPESMRYQDKGYQKTHLLSSDDWRFLGLDPVYIGEKQAQLSITEFLDRVPDIFGREHGRGLGFTQWRLRVRYPERVHPDTGDVFVASTEHCPSPLPDGGQEIRV